MTNQVVIVGLKWLGSSTRSRKSGTAPNVRLRTWGRATQATVAITQNKAGKDHRADAELLGIYLPSGLTHGLRCWFISTCRNASARTEVVELMTHNAKGDVIDAYTSWEWSTLCGELAKLELDLNPAQLIVLPVAKSETPETTAVSHQVFASDFATRDQSEVIPDGYQWRRWESNLLQTTLFRTIQ